MARANDPVVAEVKKIRRKLSKRLAAAMKKGRLYEELRAIDREVDREMAPYRRGTRKKKSVERLESIPLAHSKGGSARARLFVVTACDGG
jgi:hypothetical protein